MVRIQLSFSAEIGEEFSSWDVLHKEVQITRVLREALQAHLNS